MPEADYIRDFVLQFIIQPARSQGEQRVDVLVLDVARMMGLHGHAAAICSALRAMQLHPLSGVTQVIERGNQDSTRTSFTMDI